MINSFPPADVLQVIRQVMPLDTLCNPKLQISLNTFVKDQREISEIAEVLRSLKGREDLNKEMLAKALEGRVKPEQEEIFCGIAFDVCKERKPAALLTDIVAHRIFTMNNALIAMGNPKAIRMKLQSLQVPCALTNQEMQEYGRDFLLHALQAFMGRKEEKVDLSVDLYHTALMLKKIVEIISVLYLREKGQDCPDAIFRYRNPTGQNAHGLVAASVMGVFLRAFGFIDAFVTRSFLNPQVTLAVNHAIVVVPDREKRYIVDPCYRQFFQDIGVTLEEMPKEPILVVEEGEVDAYVESRLMSVWRRHKEQSERCDHALRNRLYENDQLHPFSSTITESIAKQSFIKVWNIHPEGKVFGNLAVEEIFFRAGENPSQKMVRLMDMSELLGETRIETNKEQLEALLRDKTLYGRSTQEACTLLGRSLIPDDERFRYSPLFNVDPRLIENRVLEVGINAYFSSLREAVNPEGRNVSVIYGCSGADCLSVFLATDASEVYFVDLTPICFETLCSIFADPSGSSKRLGERWVEDFITQVHSVGGSVSLAPARDNQQMDHIEAKFWFYSRFMGIDSASVQLQQLEGGIEIRFSWQHHRGRVPRKRKIVFVQADLTRPEKYPRPLTLLLERGFDIFYLKSSTYVTESYETFLPHLAQRMRSNGFFMTADTDLQGNKRDPESILREHGCIVEQKKPETVTHCEMLFQNPFAPMIVPYCIRNRVPRALRSQITHLSYWLFLNLRQKCASDLHK